MPSLPLLAESELTVKIPPLVPPISTHDQRVDMLSPEFKKAVQEQAEMDVLENLLKEQRWSKNTRDDVVKVVELTTGKTGRTNLV